MQKRNKKSESSVDPDSQLKGAYDTSWSKRGGGYNALTGRGTIGGANTGKCIEYGIKSKTCHICQRRVKPGKDAKTHDCRKKFSRSEKSMEPAICEELFAKDKYLKVMIGDEDSSSEARGKKM